MTWLPMLRFMGLPFAIGPGRSASRGLLREAERDAGHESAA